MIIYNIVAIINHHYGNLDHHHLASFKLWVLLNQLHDHLVESYVSLFKTAFITGEAKVG